MLGVGSGLRSVGIGSVGWEAEGSFLAAARSMFNALTLAAFSNKYWTMSTSRKKTAFSGTLQWGSTVDSGQRSHGSCRQFHNKKAKNAVQASVVVERAEVIGTIHLDASIHVRASIDQQLNILQAALQRLHMSSQLEPSRWTKNHMTPQTPHPKKKKEQKTPRKTCF